MVPELTGRTLTVNEAGHALRCGGRAVSRVVVVGDSTNAVGESDAIGIVKIPK
jgi:hypothetical protein